ncbi:MAG: hypothetical protein DMG23_01225 [Acidobacteria bacterium]|nr:MAG: hypothetical protein DMG23_01225 [Acidobacteriota bacterium]
MNKALAEYASLTQEHPKDSMIKKNYAQLLIQRGQIDQAAKLNSEILKGNPGDLDAQVQQGQILLRQGRTNDALQSLQASLKKQPGNAQAHYYLGLAFSQAGNPRQAETEWREAARIRPNLMEAQTALALVALGKRDANQLAQTAETIMKAQPSSSQGYVYHALANEIRKNLPGAEADLKKAIEVAPQNPIVYIRMADLRAAAREKFGEAEKLYEQALQLDPSAAEALLGLVRLYNFQKQPAKALEKVRAQIAKAPSGYYYFLLGQLLLRQGDLEKAEEAMQMATQMDKKNADAFLLLGQVQVARGSQEKAMTSFQRSIQENSRDPRSYVMFGALAEKRGDWKSAKEAYEKALQVEPDYPLAANNLAYLMLEHGGNSDVAFSLAQVALRGLPDLANTQDTLAWAYYQKHQYASAIRLLEEALKKTPQASAYHYHLGLAYQKAGDRVNARKHLDLVLQLNPSFAHAGEVRKALAELGGS